MMDDARWRNRAAIGLGANLGPCEETLRLAVFRITSLAGCQLCGVSSLYRSAALDCEPGAPSFLNTVVVIETRKRPDALFASLQKLEREIGGARARAEGPARYASRRLDLDLLLHGTETMDGSELTLPHPGLSTRDFVLRPLCELEPDWPFPPNGTPAHEMLARLATAPSERVIGPTWAQPPGPRDV